MQFPDHIMILRAGGKDVRVRVTADALHLMWDEGTGPQTGEGLAEQNREMIEDIVAAKLRDGDADGGEVVVAAIDIEG